MAANASGQQSDNDQVPLTVFIDKEKNKVVYAEAGKDFVDVFFSFLTLPLGTIAKLVAKDSNIEAVNFGSISSLYQSVSNLDEQFLWSNTCKEMLLNPRNSMQRYCQNMKLNIDETQPLMYYFCEDETCRRENWYSLCTFKDQLCTCGNLMNVVVPQKNNTENGFVNHSSTFVISDNLFVMPNLLRTSLSLFQKLGIKDIDAVDKQTINISKKEVVDILKFSLISKTPLTDFFFKKVKLVSNLDPRNRLEFWIGESELEDEPSDESNMVVKILRRKSNEKILFVEAKEDFADFVFSFLTFPLGGVLHMLQGFSFLSCIDNLYKSMTGLCTARCLTSYEIKEKLSKPLISMEFKLRDQILPIHGDYKDRSEPYGYMDPKSPISGGYAKGPLTFMVTDDLVMSPMSSSNVVSYLERMNVPLNDLEERVVSIGVKEGLRILKAALTTTSALTNGLSLSIMEQFFHEQKSQSIHNTN
ncbi:uncharacterized protein LOC131614158 [Vicia villosa]|uniref:uncharacterized protein LOC131614158 n=1 Tax=Vicia villosa TaxID=3911 RepID=UPI00273CCC75|nr:uncharacterized protein LOC131614158 [Vicia villosa]